MRVSTETTCECGKTSEIKMMIYGINYPVCKVCEKSINKILGNGELRK